MALGINVNKATNKIVSNQRSDKLEAHLALSLSHLADDVATLDGFLAGSTFKPTKVVIRLENKFSGSVTVTGLDENSVPISEQIAMPFKGVYTGSKLFTAVYVIAASDQFAMKLAIGVESVAEDFGDHWRYVLTDAQAEEFSTKRHDFDGGGRAETVHYDGTAFTVPVDDRPTLVLSVDKKGRIRADGIDKATISIQATPKINGERDFILGKELFEALFVDGAAEITYTATKSGLFIVESNEKFKIPGGLLIKAFRH